MKGGKWIRLALRTSLCADNLAVPRGINSAAIDLIATDPPFNSSRDFQATPNSLAKGVSLRILNKCGLTAAPGLTGGGKKMVDKKINWTALGVLVGVLGVLVAIVALALYAIVEWAEIKPFFAQYTDKRIMVSILALAIAITLLGLLFKGRRRIKAIVRPVASSSHLAWTGTLQTLSSLASRWKRATLAKGWRKMKVSLRDFNLPEIWARGESDATVIAHIAIRLSREETGNPSIPGFPGGAFVSRIIDTHDQELVKNMRVRGTPGRIAFESFLAKVAVEIARQHKRTGDGDMWTAEWEIPKEIVLPLLEEGTGYKTFPETPSEK